MFLNPLRGVINATMTSVPNVLNKTRTKKRRKSKSKNEKGKKKLKHQKKKKNKTVRMRISIEMIFQTMDQVRRHSK